jgi:hypothetical protein
VPKRDAFLIRIDPKLLDALRRWADDDFRSINGQIEFLLRRAVKQAGRAPGGERPPPRPSEDVTEEP